MLLVQDFRSIDPIDSKLHYDMHWQVIDSDPEDEAMPSASGAETADPIGSTSPLPTGQSGPLSYNMDTDISQLEAPTFTTLDRAPSQPMLSLQWDHTANLIGKKVLKHTRRMIEVWIGWIS